VRAPQGFNCGTESAAGVLLLERVTLLTVVVPLLIVPLVVVPLEPVVPLGVVVPVPLLVIVVLYGHRSLRALVRERRRGDRQAGGSGDGERAAPDPRAAKRE
jgi:membrane protein implicated in regulation of membrane protease activity